MAGIMDAIKNLDLGAAGKAAGQAAGAVTSAATTVAGAATGIQQMKDEIGEEISGAVGQAKQYAYATLTLQAIAAFAAMSIAYIQFQSYMDGKKRRTASNPRRRRAR